MVFLRSPYNYDTDKASEESGLVCPEETLTKQSFAEETDINVIVNRFMKTGYLPTAINMPTYGDFADAPDYHTALNLIQAAEEAFYDLPAELRARFENDPGQLMAFLEDPANQAEAVELGVAQAKPEVTEPVEGET